MEYFEKIEEKPKTDLAWNIPERKIGTVNIAGGNSQGFRTVVKISEYVNQKFPIETVNVILPDALKTKIPALPGVIFLPSTESGSLVGGDSFERALNSADYNLLLGDFSKNSITGKGLTDALKNVDKPTILTRDAVDLVAEFEVEKVLMNPEICLFASLPQLMKIFRAVYYPKMLLLSQSLVQVADAMHKFTLSYPVKIITLHNEQVLVAREGAVRAVPLTKTWYMPMLFWNGEVATKVMALNLFNPGPDKFLDATVAALFYNG